MSVRDDLRGVNRALLKPYAGAGASPLRRFAPVIVAIVAGLLCLPYGFFYALTTPWLLVPFVVPPTILLLLVIWAAPAAKTIPLVTMERLFFALFIGFVVWPNYLAISLPGLPWITVNRLISTPLTLMFLVSLFVQRPVPERHQSVLSATPGFWKAFLVLMAMEVITLPLSSHFGATISLLVVHQTTQTMPFFLGCYLFTRPGRATYLVYALWMTTLILCAIGVLESQVRHALWAGHIPGFLKIGASWSHIFSKAHPLHDRQYRVQAVFTGPLGLSEFLGIVTPFVLHLALSRAQCLCQAGCRCDAAANPLRHPRHRLPLRPYGLVPVSHALPALLGPRAQTSRAWPPWYGRGDGLSGALLRRRSRLDIYPSDPGKGLGLGPVQRQHSGSVRPAPSRAAKMLTHPLGYGSAGAQKRSDIIQRLDSFRSTVSTSCWSWTGVYRLDRVRDHVRVFVLEIRSRHHPFYDEDSETSFLMPAAISWSRSWLSRWSMRKRTVIPSSS